MPVLILAFLWRSAAWVVELSLKVCAVTAIVLKPEGGHAGLDKPLVNYFIGIDIGFFSERAISATNSHAWYAEIDSEKEFDLNIPHNKC